MEKVSEIVSSKIGNTIINIKNWGDVFLNIMLFGAQAKTGFDNSTALTNAMSSLPTGGTLIIPQGTFEYSSDFVINKNFVKIVFYGKLKYTGTGNAITLTGTGQTIYDMDISRSYTMAGVAADELLYTGLRLYNVKEWRLYNPIMIGFKNGILFDSSNNTGIGYGIILAPKIEQCLIGYNRPNYVGTGWANEASTIGGSIRLGGFSNYTGSKYINIEGGDNHRFYSVCLESADIERKVYCAGTTNMWYGCRFEGTNGICDVEVIGNRNQFIANDRLDWQQKITDTGQLNEFNFPAQNWQSIADRVIYIDPVNGNDANLGFTSLTAVKTCLRASDLMPRLMDHNFVVNILPGTTTDGFNLNDIRGKGTLTIQGNTASPNLQHIKYISVRNVHLNSAVIIKGVIADLYSSTATLFANYYVEDANVEFSFIHAVTVSSCGVLAGSNGKIKVTDSTISNKNQAMATTGLGGVIVSKNNSGTGNTEAILASGGTVFLDNIVIPTATTPYDTNTGGIVAAKGFIELWGTTGQRPAGVAGAIIKYYDITLSKPTWNYNNTGYKDATGTAV